MANYDGGFSGRPITLRLIVNQDWQSVENNYSMLGVKLEAIKSGNTTAWRSDPSYWKIAIHGSEWTGSWTYNFNGGIGQVITIRDWFNHAVYHNPDGTLTISVYADASDPGGYLGFASCGGNFALTTIPRASSMTYTNPMTMGQQYSFDIHRASTSFTHIIDYYFGNASGRVSTNSTEDFTWTPPTALLDQIKNSSQGTGFLRLHTYSGSNLIGYKDYGITLVAPANAVPSFTTVTHSEATPGVAANVGKYVQNISKLNLAITGAAGYQGSTITGYKIEVGGQTVNTQSGVTPSAISAAGAVVPIVATVTDSRGRTASKTVNIEVLAYGPPIINSASVVRSLGDGTPNEEGSFMRVNLNAAVQSLLNTTQRNALGIRVYSRLRGTTDWGAAKFSAVTAGITYNSFVLPSATYSIEEAYDFRVEVYDDFSTSALQLTVPTAAIFMHWDGKDGVGIGKYRTQGQLDVLGQIFQNDGRAVLDTYNIARPALLPENYRGNGSATIAFQDTEGGTALADFRQPYLPWGSRMVYAQKTAIGWDIINQSGKHTHGARALLPLSGGWYSYAERVNDQQWPFGSYTKLISGIVVLSGLIYPGTITTGTVIGQLPVGFRPDSKMIFPINNGDNPRAISINADGTIVAQSGWVNNYISLDGIAFPAAGVATWTNVGAAGSGSAFANSWVDGGDAAEGPARYWKDPYGFVWFAGSVKNGSTAADNTNIFTLPSTHRANLEQHIIANSQDNYGAVGAKPTDGINWKTNTSGATVSLAGVTLTTSEAISNNPWRNVRFFSNGFVHHGASFPVPAELRREDGLTMLKGLISGGTFGTPVWALEPENTPLKNALLHTVSNLARGRADVRGRDNPSSTPGDRASITAQQGSGWFSYDSLKYLAS